jgi:hypothetical protein
MGNKFEIYDVLADELRRLIEREHFAELSGYFGDYCYVFGRVINSTVKLPGVISDNSYKYVMKVKIHIFQERVTVSSRISTSTFVDLDWYNQLSVDFSDSDLLAKVVQYVKDISSMCTILK